VGSKYDPRLIEPDAIALLIEQALRAAVAGAASFRVIDGLLDAMRALPPEAFEPLEQDPAAGEWDHE